MYQDGRLKAEGAYHKVVLLVDEYIDIHRGEPFDLDRICKELKIIERENRKYVAIAAYKQGRRFIGTELNRRRLAVAIEKANKLGGCYAP